MAEMDSATSAGLGEFLDWAGNTGELNLTTANALKGAVGKVLQVEEDPVGVDIRSLDVESVLRRFETRYRTGYTSASMTTYKARFRQAISMYLAWLDQDPSWKTVVKTRRTSDTPRARNTTPTAVSPTAPAATTAPDSVHVTVDRMPGPGSSASRLVKHHLPLRPDLLVQIELPIDLTQSDAERVASFVKSLAFDDVPQVRDADSRQRLATGEA